MPDCVSCKTERSHADVPFIVHEADMARMERTVKRLWVVVILLIMLLVGSNIVWIVYENSFIDEIEETVEAYADDGGDAYGTIVSGDRSTVNYGKSEND